MMMMMMMMMNMMMNVPKCRQTSMNAMSISTCFQAIGVRICRCSAISNRKVLAKSSGDGHVLFFYEHSSHGSSVLNCKIMT